jgi:N-formylglutamate deformylase
MSADAAGSSTKKPNTRIEYVPGVFTYTPPTEPVSPLIFDVPRSGREYPPGFHTEVPFHKLHFLVSHYVEELWARVPESGSGLLYALFVNNYIDANRGELDIDASLLTEPWPTQLEPTEKSGDLGMGLIHSKARGYRIHTGKLKVSEVKYRIEKYWRPYHARLAELIAEIQRDFGVAFHLSCHCMGTIGPDHASDRGLRRADFCLGDRNGETSSPEFVEIVANALRARGYSVSFNTPFKGAEAVRRHGRPDAGVHSVQVEVVKELFMDEESFQRKADFDVVQADLAAVASDVASYTRSQSRKSV